MERYPPTSNDVERSPEERYMKVCKRYRNVYERYGNILETLRSIGQLDRCYVDI